MASLGRDAAAARSARIAVESYDVRLDFTAGAQRFNSLTTIRFSHQGTGPPLWVDVAPVELRSAVLNGRALDPARIFDLATGRLTLPKLKAHNELVIDAVMAYSHDGEGMHRTVDPLDDRVYLYAMSFLAAAPRWFACFDQPDLKAPVTIGVHCPDDWLVAGNGPATRTGPGTWQLAATGRLATYFTTLIAGPYHEVRDAHDGIPLVLHVRQSLAEHLDRDAAELFAHTKHCLDELHALFGVRYPWGEYHQAFVPEFNAGAMENPGCVTLRDDLIFRSRATDADRDRRAVTIAHEMAHMWFGDLVTMQWWDDLWLNESFAEYLGHRVCGPQAWVAFGIERKSWGYAADRRPSTHPVAGNGAADTDAALSEFDGISYAKGASVLRQLAAWLGDDVFLGGLRRYIGQYAGGNARLQDLLAAWTASGAVDLDTWSSAWLRTPGFDALTASDGQLVRYPAPAGPHTHRIEVATFADSGAERGRVAAVIATDRTSLGVDSAALVVPDAGDETWAKIVLSPAAWEAMPATLSGLSDPRARVVIWNALLLAVADADIDPRRAIDVVVAGLAGEPSDAVIGVVGRWAIHTLAGAYLPPADAVAARARLAGAMLAVISVAAPESGRQLAAARIAVGATWDAELLRGRLAGRDVPPGLAVDAELQWAIRYRLAQLGSLTDLELAAALAADPGSQGTVHAARCRAARPDSAAKETAWAQLMGDPALPNYELYALAEGFWQPTQLELTAAFVPRYFTEIAGAAALRSGWVADRLAWLAYPWPAVVPDTWAATQWLIAQPGLPTGVRRSVVDAGDDLRRALGSRARFALPSRPPPLTRAHRPPPLSG